MTRGELMRSQQEMFDLILGIAQHDERIRAVVLNGSRANPHAPTDIFQDYDVVYYVTETAPYRENLDWIEPFGERIILQMPDAMGAEPDREGRFAYLMQFTDGNRIDLSIAPLDHLVRLGEDSLTRVLLDKDGVIGNLPEASEKSYLPTQPTAKAFEDCCNEFWWVNPYVAKAFWRDQLVYAKDLLESVLRKELLKLLTWHVGQRTDFQVNLGKSACHLHQHLEPDLWEAFLETYVGPELKENWEALLAMGQLFRRIAIPLAKHYGFSYPQQDDQRVTAFLEHIRQLPKDANQIYE